MEHSREPCPWRILDDLGGAFVIGFIGGSLFQGIAGMRNAPSGFRRRMVGGLNTMKNRAPQVAGNFGVWAGLFSAIDCTMSHYRAKEDPWNSIMSGALTGGVLSARTGVPAMLGNATVGGIFLGLIEGTSIVISKLRAKEFPNHIIVRNIENTQSETVNPDKKYNLIDGPKSIALPVDLGSNKG